MFGPPPPPIATSSNELDVATPWCVLIVDDEPMVHTVTRLALRDMTFEGRGVALHSAHSAEQARSLLAELPSVAVAFIDVVMESDHAGLDLVSYIRTARRDPLMRIVLRTGQPGAAPERVALRDYDINAYLEKTGVDATRLHAALLAALRSFGEVARLHEAMRHLESLAATDPLTGLGSRRNLRAALTRALSSARRRAEPLSIAFLDLDDFKKVNDEQGHLRGDEVLRAVGSAILSQSRSEDGGFRYGGDEFVVILPCCTLEQARDHYGRRLADEFTRIGIVASLGIVQTGPLHYDDGDTLLQLADANMYATKRARKELLGGATQEFKKLR